jgi:hypothetical protein
VPIFWAQGDQVAQYGVSVPIVELAHLRGARVGAGPHSDQGTGYGLCHYPTLAEPGEIIRVFPSLFAWNIKTEDFKKFSKKCLFLNLLICMYISINLQKNRQIIGKRLRKVLTAPYIHGIVSPLRRNILFKAFLALFKK